MVKGFFKSALYVVSCVLQAAVVGLLLLTASLLSVQVALTLQVAPVALAVTHAMPGWLAFMGALSSPFGGVFRTDFVILAALTALFAKVVRKIAKAL